MIKNILVPIDGSEVSYYGLNYAVDIASSFQAKIHLGNFIAPAMYHIPVQGQEAIFGNASALQVAIMNDERRQVEKKLQRVMDVQVPADLQGKVLTKATSDFREVDQFCEDANVDMVIMGSSGNHSLWELFMGNNTENVIRRAPVPVLALSEPHSFQLKNVLISTDLSENIPEQLLTLCRSFQKTGAKVHLVNILESDLIGMEEVQQKMKEYVRKHQLQEVKIHIRSAYDFISGFEKALSDINPDLVLMKTYDKNAFWSFFEGSLAEKVISTFPVPTLVERV